MNTSFFFVSSAAWASVAVALAACSAGNSSNASTSAALSATSTDYADADYDEGFDLDPSTSDSVTSSFNTNDVERPPGFPETWLYVRYTCGPTACSNMYDLYAYPSAVSPRYAFHHGCIGDPADFQGGTFYGNMKDFLTQEVPSFTWEERITPVDDAHPASASASPDYAWDILTSLIDSRRPFIAGVSWDDTPSATDVGHVLTVVDYKIDDAGKKYVLLVNFGHYIWYPFLDKPSAAPPRYGFHTRWHVISSGETYARIHPTSGEGIPAATWAAFRGTAARLATTRAAAPDSGFPGALFGTRVR
jgi:hypothetical protein